MGILDDLLGAAKQGAGGALGGMLGGAQPGQGAGGLNPVMVLQIVSTLLNQRGGLGGLVGAFNNAGLGDVVKSWISIGQNLPISPSQVTQVLGSGTVGQVAQQLGMSAGNAGDLLAKLLPQVVDQLTPRGQVEQGHQAGGDPLTAAIGALAGKLFSPR